MKRSFKSSLGNLQLPLFFPDATRAVIKTIDSVDIKNTQTPGLLVNTYHLYQDLGSEVIEKFRGIRKFMNWSGAAISDSGGFQIMSLIKNNKMPGKITDRGVVFYPHKGKRMLLTPEKSVAYQMSLKTDLLVVLDDFTDPAADYKKAKESVERTINWAGRSKSEFLRICTKKGLTKDQRPYLIGVVQGGEFQDLRAQCAKKLVEIGFDGLGYGGWPIDKAGKFDFVSAKTIADNAPANYFLYGLGVGKPDEIVACSNMGYGLFDCVLPTRDARHKRLYVFNAPSIKQINIKRKKFYSFFNPDKEKYFLDKKPVSLACDCLLCKNYSRAYLRHLFKINEMAAMRLSTIHNLRFYSLLMEKIQRG